MRRRRFYGKPLPAKRQVRAHLEFFKQVNEDAKMNIEFSENEITVMKTVLYADVKRLNDLVDHASAHGQELHLPHQGYLASAIEKLEGVT